MTIKDKKCRHCGDKFTPRNSLQVACSYPCALTIAKKQKDQQWQKEKKQRKEALLTHSEWLNLLQKVFNTYIRARDKGRPCISCGCAVDNGHASHMFSVGGNPNVRFNEDNVHLACVECNLHKHGNLVEYALRLPERIGKDRFDKLVIDSKTTVLKLSIPEIKEKIIYYKALTKSLI